MSEMTALRTHEGDNEAIRVFWSRPDDGKYESSMSGTNEFTVPGIDGINEKAGFIRKPRNNGSVSCESTGSRSALSCSPHGLSFLRTCSVITLDQTVNQSGIYNNKDTIKVKSDVVSRPNFQFALSPCLQSTIH